MNIIIIIILESKQLIYWRYFILNTSTCKFVNLLGYLIIINKNN